MAGKRPTLRYGLPYNYLKEIFALISVLVAYVFIVFLLYRWFLG